MTYVTLGLALRSIERKHYYMIYLVLSLVALGIVAALIGAFSKNGDARQPSTASCATCNGHDERCEQECMMEAATKDIEYYDDEELDQYRNRPSDGYTDAEVEEFSNVLYTMRQEDVRGWNRSLILRGINLPDQLKDEVVMMIEDD